MTTSSSHTQCRFSVEFIGQARKRHININFFVRLVPVFTGFVPGTNRVCPWDKSGEKLGQTQEFSLFYTVEARFHRVCPWDKPGLSLGQSRGRRAAQKVYVKKVYVPFSLANAERNCPEKFLISKRKTVRNMPQNVPKIVKLSSVVQFVFNWPFLGEGPNMVSESTVSNTELSEFFGAH